MRAYLTTFITITVVMLWPFAGQAKVSGPCSDCHTMHNSQSGSPVAYQWENPGGGWQKTTSTNPNPKLLVSDCLGCHTGTNTTFSINTEKRPYVFDPAADYGASGTGTDGNTLAGGNFKWVADGNNAKGHNILAIDPGQSARTPPGGSSVMPFLTCAGTNGCHGKNTVANELDSLEGAHHGNGSIQAGYRFLAGVQGYEDPEWEFTPTQTLHNQYRGQARIDETEVDGASISDFCARCHGAFHHGIGSLEGGSPPTFASPWLRHPTDFDMNEVKQKEFGGYGGALNTYNVVVPLASTDASSSPATVRSTVLQAAGDAVVMCLSCHRAHGSPHDSILRWNYKAWPGAGGYAGCQACHTAKN